MRVKEYLMKRIQEGTIHMTLIDPAKQDSVVAARIAETAEQIGTDAIMVGGSTGVTQENLDLTILEIKKLCKLPVIYFPSGAHAISRHCDAIYFMSVLNSQNVKNVIGEQVRGAPIIKKLGLETIPMGYVIVEPGMKVGEVSKADLIPRNNPQLAVAYALAAQYMGMELFYLEAGSGSPQPVPETMIREVKKNISIPLIVGGGIREPEEAVAIKNAGANAIVTGTIVENGDFATRLEKIITAIKK
ncbi:MAG: geranylgeranylglyceryl/heptaprenylglyceryl phosphate synthase [Methanomassiliicoccales archaeon]|nr:geranylgeranylglyceryl/heptaprenylglyceryl phosphate synthase [Methanomassiliicoccales archaeon]